MSGAGVAGVIARISDITVTGTVAWSAETIREERESSKLFIGEMVR